MAQNESSCRLESPLEDPAIPDIKTTNSEGRLIAIGDIHGCSAALHALLEAVGPRPNDTIVTLGDYVDWGPDSRGVIELLLGLSKICNLIPLMGNHEELLLEAVESESKLRSWLDCGGEETLASYPYLGGSDFIPKEHVQFIRNCRDFYETSTHIFVHANYDPRLPLARTGGTKLRWEFIDTNQLQPHVSGKTVVVGHTPQASGLVLDLEFLVCIDTDCSRGGWLTAFDVQSRGVIQANQEGQIRNSEMHSP